MAGQKWASLGIMAFLISLATAARFDHSIFAPFPSSPPDIHDLNGEDSYVPAPSPSAEEAALTGSFKGNMDIHHQAGTFGYVKCQGRGYGSDCGGNGGGNYPGGNNCEPYNGCGGCSDCGENCRPYGQGQGINPPFPPVPVVDHGSPYGIGFPPGIGIGFPHGTGFPLGNGFPHGIGFPLGNGFPHGMGYPIPMTGFQPGMTFPPRVGILADFPPNMAPHDMAKGNPPTSEEMNRRVGVSANFPPRMAAPKKVNSPVSEEMTRFNGMYDGQNRQRIINAMAPEKN